MSTTTGSPPPDTQTERFHGLDGLRAVMMLLGLVLHSGVGYMTSASHLGTPTVFQDSSTWFLVDVLIGFIHTFRMPVFMFIAGFFSAMMVEKRGIMELLKNRGRRVGIPFVVGLVVLIPAVGASFAFATRSMDVNFDALAGNPHIGLTLHLWFLYFLLIFYVTASVLVTVTPDVARRFVSRIFEHLIQIPGGSLVLSLPLMVMLIPSSGLIPTDTTFTPSLRPLGIYGFMFACGWVYWSHQRHLRDLRNATRAFFHLASVVVLFGAWWFVAAQAIETELIGWKVASSFFAAVLIWQAIWGFAALFLLLVDKPVPLVRYLVDGSYWAYLVHVPPTIFLPALLAGLPWHASAKFSVVLLGTLVMCFGSYELFVRSSIIGEVLNGQRWPRALPAAITNRPLIPNSEIR